MLSNDRMESEHMKSKQRGGGGERRRRRRRRRRRVSGEAHGRRKVKTSE